MDIIKKFSALSLDESVPSTALSPFKVGRLCSRFRALRLLENLPKKRKLEASENSPPKRFCRAKYHSVSKASSDQPPAPNRMLPLRPTTSLPTKLPAVYLTINIFAPYSGKNIEPQAGALLPSKESGEVEKKSNNNSQKNAKMRILGEGLVQQSLLTLPAGFMKEPASTEKCLRLLPRSVIFKQEGLPPGEPVPEPLTRRARYAFPFKPVGGSSRSGR